ncbi:Pyridine nucleotide-disulfide oxidoreductase, FAD/NAD(P)-binding domain containing protein [Desulfovibrio sp. X2]|uniref:dihydrolipoyl dehydrogenase family protein n=1 Tax=Desulfovibrio sp. X2 TaxID=941449 RepID=UPI0003587035|nr:FAD-dependent oxidoreductase [Desulfovibrio sp. X2]EPR44401.1 Pyridine nucleotide-disulfide oxidoreductase, FAD/NAD(P)-binding domain containing protein [Desulfovibrio sp. X2]
MAAYDYDIGIIGGGAAGLTVAAGAAQLGAKCVVLEKEKALGGDCLHYGCVPSKTLLATARAARLVRVAHHLGLPPAAMGPVDFRKVRERIFGVISAIQRHDSPERFCSLGAEVRFGHARFLDEHKVECDGKAVTAARWVLCVGSSAAAPDIPGLAETGYLTNREIFSLDALPRSLVILGAGPLAIEMAQAFQRLGSQVTVVQRGHQILSREDPDMAGVVMEQLEREGVKFHLGCSVTRVRSAEGRKEVVFEKLGRELVARGEHLLVALGRRANVLGLDLDAAGVKHTAQGITVDERLRTSQKHIFAAGDATGGHMFTHAAGYEGGIVVTNAVFRVPRKTDYTWLPHCTYSEPELGGIGLNEREARELGIEYTVYTESFANNDRALAEGMAEGKLKLLLDEKERPIGVQIAGLHAGELLNEWIAVACGKVKLATLAAAVHPYPTLGESAKRVAGDYFSSKIFSDTVKKGLHFLFHYKGRACEPSEEG